MKLQNCLTLNPGVVDKHHGKLAVDSTARSGLFNLWAFNGLAPWIFFTKQFWPQSPEHLTPLLAAGATPYRIKQVHGNQVLRTQQLVPASATDASAAGVGTIEPFPRPEADGITERWSGRGAVGLLSGL